MREIRAVPKTSMPMWLPMTTMTGLVAALLATVVYVIMATNSASTISSSQTTLRTVVVDAAITKVQNLINTAANMIVEASYSTVMVDYVLQIIANGGNSTNVYSNMFKSPVGSYLWSLTFIHKDVVGIGVLTYALDIFIAQNRSMIFQQDITTGKNFTSYPLVKYDPVTFAPIIASNFTYPVLQRPYDPYYYYPELKTCTGYGTWTAAQFGAAFKQFILTLYRPIWNTVITDCTGSSTRPPVLSYLVMLTTGTLQSFLSSIYVSPNSVISLWEYTGNLISSNIPGPVEDWGSAVRVFGVLVPALYNVTKHPNPSISGTASILIKAYGSLAAIPDRVQIEDSVNGTAYIIDVKRIQDPNKLNLLLVLTTPRADVWGEIESGRDKTIAVIAAVATAMFIVGLLFAFGLTRPIRNLIKVMEEVANFKFDSLQGDKIQERSVLLELGMIQVAFHKMVVKFAEAIEANKKLATSGAHSGARGSISGPADKRRPSIA